MQIDGYGIQGIGADFVVLSERFCVGAYFHHSVGPKQLLRAPAPARAWGHLASGAARPRQVQGGLLNSVSVPSILACFAIPDLFVKN